LSQSSSAPANGPVGQPETTEPFASVDAQTQAELEDLVLRVREHLGMTIVFVTHDIESVYLGDRVIVLSKSPTNICQIDHIGLPSPRDQVSTKELPEFTTLRTRVARAIRGDLTREPEGPVPVEPYPANIEPAVWGKLPAR